jgi:hypothetical protein
MWRFVRKKFTNQWNETEHDWSKCPASSHWAGAHLYIRTYLQIWLLYLLSTFKKLVSNVCSPAENQHITITSSVPFRKLQIRNDAHFDVSFRQGAFNWNRFMWTKCLPDTDCQCPAARTLASYTGSPRFNLGPETIIPRAFVLFVSPSRQKSGNYFTSAHNHFQSCIH